MKAFQFRWAGCQGVAGILILTGLLSADMPAFAASQAAKRLKAEIEDSQTFELKGNTRPVVANGIALDQGPVADSQILPRMTIHLAPTAAQTKDLDEFLVALQTRHSAQFHKFLTPEQYADRFGLNSADIEKVTRWLENSGFSNVETARSRTWVSFSGTAGQAQAAFHTSIHKYLVNGEAHFANTSDPQLPRALEGIAQSVMGLHDFHPKPASTFGPRYTTPNGTQTSLAPDDWATIYNVKPLYSQGLTGTGVSIVVVGQSDYNPTDIQNFRTAAGLPALNVTTHVVGTDPGIVDPNVNGDQREADLDIEWAGGIAKNAGILFYVAHSAFTAMTTAIDDNAAPIVSVSFSSCEADLTTSYFSSLELVLKQGNAQGITIAAASGDAGVAGCDSQSTASATKGLAVNYPASSQYVTGVGGTELEYTGAGNYFGSTNNSAGGSALSYVPEKAWNDPPTTNYPYLEASGGGVSRLSAKPSWQTGTGVPSDGFRDVPDVAFTASILVDPYLICGPTANGTVKYCTAGTFADASVSAGTSAATPSFAGSLALLVQKYGPLGNVNPNLYTIAAISDDIFHDISGGNNGVPCTAGSTGCPASGELPGYTAGTGYDQVTGWGSVDANHLYEIWNADFAVLATPASLTIQPGSSGTATVQVAAVKQGFTGAVTFSCSVSSNMAQNVTCSVPSGNTTLPVSTTVTISAAGSTAAAPPTRIHSLPNMRRPATNWLLLFGVLPAAAVWLMRRPRIWFASPKYAWSAGLVCMLTVAAVSCSPPGGGGSTHVQAPQLFLTCTVPLSAQVGSAYSSGSCSASGGSTPYTYSISNGKLPAGLSLNSSTGAITGTPTAPGTESFTVTATDSSSPAQTASQAETGFVVTETGTVTITATTTAGNIVNSTTIAVTVP